VAAPSSELIAERAYADLRDRIVTLRLAPGTALREDDLMRELAIGRTPLREAVKRLALESLVAVQPRRGTFVTSVDSADIAHITEVRVELEAQAASLAAVRMDDAGRRRLLDLTAELDALAADAGPEPLIRLDERVHREIWQAAGNPYLLDTLERLFALSLRVWYLVLDRVPTLGGTVHDQGLLLQAVAGGDAERAGALMREHVLRFQREILSAFESR